MRGRLLSFGCLFTLVSSTAAAAQAGVILEKVTDNFAVQRAGLRPGDVVVGWRRDASPPANPEGAEGEIRSWFDFRETELFEAPRGRCWLRGLRAGQPFVVAIPAGPWRVRLRPAWMPPHLEKIYAAGDREVKAGRFDAGMGLWRRAVERADRDGRWDLATWFLSRMGDIGAQERNWRETAAAYQACASLAEARGLPLVAAWAWNLRALAMQNQNDVAAATESYERGLALNETHAPGSLRVGIGLNALALIWRTRGDLRRADELATRSLAIMERWAPDSDYTFTVLQNLGVVATDRGDLDRGEGFYRRALALSEKLDKGGLEVAELSTNLGSLALQRGDLPAAQDLLTRAHALLERLAPESVHMSAALAGLGIAAKDRGDLAAAEVWLKRDLELQQKVSPESRSFAESLLNLGNLAMGRGDLDGADSYYRRSLKIEEKLAPEGPGVASCLSNLGALADRRGETVLAEEQYRRALDLHRRHAPGGVVVAAALRSLGRLELARRALDAAERDLGEALQIEERLAPGGLHEAATLGDLARLDRYRKEPAAAERRLTRALAIVKRLAPGSALEAVLLSMLAEIRRSEGRLPEAVELWSQAVASLDAQRGRAGPSEESRAAYAAQHADIYRSYVEALVESGRGEEAFHALERSRARSFLARLAERDIVLAREIPPELERERRAADAAYDRAQLQLSRANPDDQELIDTLVARLRDLRSRQAEVAARIREASPRLASLRYPAALDASAARGSLDAGTVLLSYSVGPTKTLLFVVSAATTHRPPFAVYTIPIDRDTLRSDVRALRNLIERHTGDEGPYLARAQKLFTLLVGPARRQIDAAARLVICPDDQLHALPFGALHDTSEGFLVSWKPLHLAASAAAYAEILRSRGAPVAAEQSLLAFGDPRYLDREAATRLQLTPLPGARRELEALASLFGDQAVVFAGDAATEERVKSLDLKVRYLHFACHAFLDDRFPLDSGLALTMPAAPAAGRENGLLQAWEIIEQVRVRADLVSLSACRTAAGPELAGEGILGLTRAFQFAGAQSVLASLWSVPDEATALLMTGFFRYREQGYAKDAALRAAQLELIASRSAALREPFAWAGFQLAGDWR